MTVLDPTHARHRPGLDLDWLLGIIGDDPAFLAELVALYEQDSGRLVGQVRQAVDRSDGEAMRRAVHTLKGLLCHLGESPALDRCRRIEALGAGLFPVAAEVDALAVEVAQIREEFARLAH